MDKTEGIHESTIHSEILGEEVTFQYYIPKNYTDLYKYHTIFTFDSQDFFKYGQIDRIYERLYKENKIERAIIIGIPYPTVEWRNHYFHPEGDKSTDFMRFVTKEFAPFVDKNFSTFKMGSSRILMGESLAGSFALKTAISYPNTFNKVLAFSPMISDTFKDFIIESPGIEKIDFYHTIGLDEKQFTTIMGKEADFLTPNRELNEEIEYTPYLYTYKELEGGHIWKTWKPELEHAVEYFIKK